MYNNIMQRVSEINFSGNFNYGKLKLKQSQKLNEILKTQYYGESNEELLKKLPYDIDVYCVNPTKRAINPRFKFWLSSTKRQATLRGMILLTSKDAVEQNVLKLRNFILNFDKKFKSLKGDEKLTRAEETQRQVDFLLFGRWS